MSPGLVFRIGMQDPRSYISARPTVKLYQSASRVLLERVIPTYP